ncbi:hypothetical protein C1H46_003565 [Malus baccata]|uniref:Uncharacterized protein n=1 Tax=Malus baccata TaxID=106549 RepID=A0A540NIL4_MALBA|nr:hypothetical protein C1H46_003565 [Malus baccata]
MVSGSPKCLTAVDGSFTTENRLQRGKLRPSLDPQNKAFKEDEPFLESAPLVNPRCISRCCIENGLFTVVPIHFEFLCGEATDWAECVDAKNGIRIRNIGPFHYDIPLADTEIFKALQKGAPTFPSKAFRFNDWIKHLWQKSQELNCRFEAMMSVAWSLCFLREQRYFPQTHDSLGYGDCSGPYSSVSLIIPWFVVSRVG